MRKFAPAACRARRLRESRRCDYARWTIAIGLVAALAPVVLEAEAQELVQLEVVGGGVSPEFPPERRRDAKIERREVGLFGFGLRRLARRPGGFGCGCGCRLDGCERCYRRR